MSFTYTKLEKSIEDVGFEYITNLDDYKTLSHILDVIILERVKKATLQGIFNKISLIFKKTIDDLSKMTKRDGKTIELSSLQRYISSNKNKKIILVKNEDYNSFASYRSKLEDKNKIEKTSNKVVFYNVGQLETSGSISVVPTNANVFLSSLLYSYALLWSEEFYSRQSLDELINVSKIYYTMILSVFGRKSGLMTGARREKEYLYFIVSSFVFSLYAKENRRNTEGLRNFIMSSASTSGSSYLNEYMNAISNVELKYSDDPFNVENYDDLFKLVKICNYLNLLEVSESEMKIQWFRLLGIYGIMALENYARLVAYLVATYIPNSFFSSTMKVYNKASYEYLIEHFVRSLFSF